MKIILTENIASLGHIGQTVKVAPGYARNFLLPKGLALLATGKNVKEIEHKKRLLEAKREKYRLELRGMAEKLNQVVITVRRKVAEDERLYGSVSVTDIVKVLIERGFGVDKKDVRLDQPIKSLGQFAVPLKLDAEVSAEIKVIVEKEADEAPPAPAE